jgi:hypothetical protein
VVGCTGLAMVGCIGLEEADGCTGLVVGIVEPGLGTDLELVGVAAAVLG